MRFPPLVLLDNDLYDVTNINRLYLCTEKTLENTIPI
jgi:hypothetical protein